MKCLQKLNKQNKNMNQMMNKIVNQMKKYLKIMIEKNFKNFKLK